MIMIRLHRNSWARCSDVTRRLLAALLLVAIISAAARVGEAGLNTWTSNGPEGGRVLALAVDPITPSIIYASTYTRGVFRSTDGGASWNRSNAGLFTRAVAAFAIDPKTPSTLYALTDGVAKSTDGGASWNPLSTTGLPIGGVPTPRVVAFAIDPKIPSTLYVGTVGRGIFKSTDGGATWGDVNTQLTLVSTINAILIDPTTSSTLYAAVESQDVNMFKSTDGGTSWSEVLVYPGFGFVRTLAIDPVNPSTLYAGEMWGTGGAYKSTDGGTTWAAINAGLTATNVPALAIDPTTSTTLYAGTADGVFKSVDGGATWNTVNAGLTSTYVNALAIDPTTPSTLYTGTDGDGVFKSTNSATSWSAANTRFIATAILALAIDPATPSTLYAGSTNFETDFRVGGVFKSTDGGTSWGRTSTELTATEIHALAIDPAMPNILYAGTYGGGVFKTLDGGDSWNTVNTGLTEPMVSALAIDAANPSSLYAGTDSSGVFKSTNGGASWSIANSGLPTSQIHIVQALVIDPAVSSTLYAGMNSGGVFKSTDDGANWNAVNTGLPPDFYSGTPRVTALVIDPASSSTLYAGTDSRGVFKSSDGGATWNEINVGLAGWGIWDLAIDPTTPSTLYAGGQGLGVFRTTDSGTSWSPVATGLTNGFVNTLAVDPVAPRTVYAGTFGGVFRIDQTSGETVGPNPVLAGGSCSTDIESDGATTADPVETTVYTPNAGLCGINEQPATGTALTGYSLFGYAVTITAPPASATVRLTFVFEIDGSIIPPGQTYNTIQLLKNGVRVATCVGGNDPCMKRHDPLPNGGARLTVQTSSASVWSPVVATLDSYLCYTSAATKGTAPGGPSSGHLLTDALASTRFDFTKSGALCLAAARDGAAITDGATALQSAALKAGKVCSDTKLACRNKKECTAPATCDAQAKFVARKNVTVLNALGAIVVDATKPTTVLLPSGTSASTPPSTPNPGLDTFTCYATKPHPNVCTGDPTRACESDAACGDAGPCFAAFPKDLTVRLDEPVATPNGKTFVVKKPTALCLPAELDETPRKVPSVALQCYAIAPAKKQCTNASSINAGESCKEEEDCGGQKKVTSFCAAQAKHAPSIGIPISSDALGTLERDTKKEAEVCVPSEAVVR